ncbi:discoidin domain-containing protein [Lysinibacillus macroides]|uniref:F5/8 type C domain-containing protein n=1 Tax=Lysinibacillus macroides TaxID=33935 RepID=A0A0N0CWK4_9BACI|nr:discoidin domain-containing protein [Lysinibacillus macroides]KOY83014.1 hypothetical protein ADM90_06810 [Lysinibacillus macroides]QPR70134.1 discoidin domain-containing protein [Lysinibacillus macroides]
MATKKILIQYQNRLYSSKIINIINHTKMTSNTTPAPLKISASSTNTGNSNYQPWKVFNGTNAGGVIDSWLSGNVTTGWIQIDYGVKKIANRVAISAQITSAWSTILNAPKDFNILGSNNDVNFEIIGQYRNQINWSSGETRNYNISKPNFYRYYRIQILSVNGAGQMSLSEVLFSYTYPEVTEISFLNTGKLNSNNFIKYGVNLNEYTLNVLFSHKKYILQDTISENEEGLWETQLGRKPLSISFS